MMYDLYYSPGTASFAVHWLLLELGLPHRLRAVDLAAGEHRRPPYLALNPAGVVPTLVDEGRPLTEAAAIVLTLADRHAPGRLAPLPGDAARGPYYQWAFFCANTLQPAYRHWFYPDEAAGAAAAEGARASARARIEGGLERLDAQLASGGPYLLGGQLSAVDFLATMLLRWSRAMPKPATDWPALAAYVATMRALPSFAAVCDREGLTDWR